jgi:uncharacterized membrane protein YbhN (UPF0104 family)
VNSVNAFVDAVQAFFDRLVAVHWPLLLAAIGFSVLNLALRSRAWQQILRAAFPGERFRYRTAFGAYCAGVGVNAIIPARVGDLVKVFLVKRSRPATNYPTLIATLVAETVFDFVVASCLLGWALAAGALPGVRLPHIPAFDFSWVLRHPVIAGIVAGVLLALALFAAGRVRAFWRKFGRGLAILKTPGRYLRSVASWQALGWCCRIASAYFFLEAFGVPGSLENALLVQVASSLGSLLPATPGGLGPKQALLVVVLAGTAGRTDVLAFSAGMELTLVIVNVVLGFLCMGLILRSFRFRRAIGQARAGAGEAGA